jgi:cold-inducible RNA-binding protein
LICVKRVWWKITSLDNERYTMKIFVGGLSWGTDSDGLKSAFEQFGSVSEAIVVTDKFSGRSRGFGFVTYDSADDGRKAIEQMNESELDGRRLNVNEARERKPRNDRGGGGGGYRGGRRD